MFKPRDPIMKQLDEDIAVIEGEQELQELEDALNRGIWLVENNINDPRDFFDIERFRDIR